MAGYSIEILQEKDRNDKYTCTYCKMLLREPHQNECGHLFCKACIDVLTGNSGTHKCPICALDSEKDPEVNDMVIPRKCFRDNALKKEMKRLNTKCHNQGCEWSGPFGEYEEHEPTCIFSIFPCPNGCGHNIKRLDSNKHTEKECPFRLVECRDCGNRLRSKDLKKHVAECPDHEINCEFCVQKMARKKIADHVDVTTGNCPKKLQPCKYRDIGCYKTVEFGKELDHNTEYVEEHLSMIFEQMVVLQNIRSEANENSTKIQQLNNKVQQHQEIIFNLRRAIKSIEDDLVAQPRLATSEVSTSSLKDFKVVIEKFTKSRQESEMRSNKLEGKVATFESIVSVLNQDVEKCSDMVQTIAEDNKNFQGRLTSVEKKAKAQDRIIALKDVTLAEQDLRIQSLEMASYDGILVWKITDFGRKRRDAISGRTLSLYSPYFFTSRFGYKMCARIYLNGDGMGKGNHVSLFFVVMKGEFDDILKWPFRQKVTFMWIDQNNREHMIDAFRPDPNSSSFKKPTGDMNIASGCPLFMPLNMLESSQHAYVKDNTAFLRVIVDTHDL